MEIKASQDTPLIELLLEAFPQSNKTRLKKMIKLASVRFQGAVVKHPDLLIKKGQSIEFKKYTPQKTYREKAPFQVVYEDADVIAVLKPAGILTAGRTTEKMRSMFGMVQSWLSKTSSRNRKSEKERFPKVEKVKIDRRYSDKKESSTALAPPILLMDTKPKAPEAAYTIHRLDREVSGILLFAKTEKAQIALKANWAKVDKYYYALVEGTPEKPKGVIRSWICEDHKQKMYSLPIAVTSADTIASTPPQADAKLAITEYELIEKYEGCSLLRVKLETGRKNQIRLHLSNLACPIIGDRKYGADDTYRRQVRLFAYAINFPHPSTGKMIKIELPMPKTFLVLNKGHESY
ncbi:MAG: RluA family pseudouridine synthase [Bacteroidales bacterium]